MYYLSKLWQIPISQHRHIHAEIHMNHNAHIYTQTRQITIRRKSLVKDVRLSIHTHLCFLLKSL